MSENIIDIHVSRILSKSSFNHTASSVFRQMLEKIPDPIFPTKKQQSNFQQIQDALEDFWITDRSLISIILPCLALADVNPFDCFDQFSSNLPEINQNTAPKKGTGGKTFYTDLLNDIDWDQPKNRLCGLSLNLMVLCYFFDLIISQVKLEDKLFNSSFIKLFFRIFNLFPKDTNEFYSTAYHKPAKFIAPTICKFTLNLDTKFTINTFDQIFGVEDKTHKIKASEALSSPMLEVYLYFFSQVNFGSTISNDLLSNAHKLLEKIRCVGNKVKDYDSSLHYAVLACMYNVVGLLFINDRTFSTSKIISEIYDFTLSLIKNSYYKGPAHALHTLIYVFADDNKNITMPIMKYINKYLKPLVGKPEFAGCFLQSIIILLRGKNYKQNSLLKLTGENFNWRTKKEFFGSDTRQFMVSSIFSSNNSACFVDYQTELSDFFLQYSSDPSSGFARDIFPKLMLESFKKNNMRSVLITIKRMLSPRSGYPQNLGFQDQLADLAHSTIVPLINDESKQQNTENNMKLCKTYTILQSLKMNHDDIYKVLDENLSMIQIVKAPLLSAKIVSTQFQKWAKRADLPLTINRYEANIEFVNQAQIIPKNSLQALEIVPLVTIDEEIIIPVCEIICSTDIYLSLLASRILESIHYQNENNGKLITKQIVLNLVNHMSLVVANLFRYLSVIQQQIEISASLNRIIDDEQYKLIEVILMISLCCSYYQVRILALNIIEQIKQVIPQNKINLNDFIEQNDEKISKIAKENILRGYIQSEEIIQTCINISFKDVASSQCNSFYQYYLAVFANEYIKYENNEELGKNELFNMLEEILNNDLTKMKFIDPLFYGNLLIFWSNAHIETIDQTKFMNYHNNICELLNNDEINLINTCEAMISSLELKALLQLFDYTILKPTYYLTLLIGIRNELYQEEFINLDYNDPIFKSFWKFFDFISFQFNKEDETSELFKKEINNNLIITSKTFFQLIYNKNNAYPNGPYLRTPIFLLDQIENFQKDKWLTFILEDCSLIPIANKTLHYLLSITKSQGEELSTKLKESEFVSWNILDIVLNKSPKLLDKYINHSAEFKSNYFDSIANQFIQIESKKDFFKKLKQRNVNQQKKEEEEFTQIYFMKTGSLLALSFYYLALAHNLSQTYSFLTNIIFSSSLINNDKTLTNLLIEEFDKIGIIQYSEFSELFSDVILELSTLLSLTHSFCGEQFVYQMFQIIIKIKDLQLLRKLLLYVIPWIRSISFDLNSKNVLQKTSKYFSSFSLYSFIESNISILSNIIMIIITNAKIQQKMRLSQSENDDNKNNNNNKIQTKVKTSLSPPTEFRSLIDQVIEYQVKTDQISSFKIYLLNCVYNLSRSHRVGKTFLSYLFSAKRKETVQILFNFLKFSSWLNYHNLVAKERDTSINTNIIMKNTKHVSRDRNSRGSFLYKTKNQSQEEITIKKSKRKGSSESENRDYELENGLLFSKTYTSIINFILPIIYDQLCKEQIQSQAQILLSFSITMMNTFPKALNILTKFIPNYKKDIGVDIDSIIGFINTFDEKQKEEFGFEILSWGTMCGDLNIAKIAMKIYSHILIPYNNDVEIAIMNSIIDVSQAIYELRQTVEIKDIIDISYEYISICISALSELVKKLEKPSIEIVKLTLQFISYVNQEIVINSLILLNNLLQNNYISNTLQNSSITGFYQILEHNNTQIKNPKIIYDIICQSIITNNLNFLMNNEKSLPVTCLLLLTMKYIFNDLINSRKIIFKLSEKFDDKLICEQLNEKVPETDLYLRLSKMIDSTEVKTILNILLKMQNINKSTNSAYIYELATKLLNNETLNSNIFDNLVNIATDDKTPGNSFAIHNFITKWNQRNKENVNKTDKADNNPQKKTQFLNLEPLKRIDNVIQKMTRLEKINEFLPMWLIDPAFHFCPSVAGNMCVSLQIDIDPFTSWEKLMKNIETSKFKAESYKCEKMDEIERYVKELTINEESTDNLSAINKKINNIEDKSVAEDLEFAPSKELVKMEGNQEIGNNEKERHVEFYNGF